MQIKIQHKKASWDKQEVGELILGAATVALSVLLFFTIVSPTFDKNEETAKSYHNILEEQLEIAEKEGTGQFHIWPIPVRAQQAELYLVHFAQELRVEHEGEIFISEDSNKHQLCVCTLVEGITNCQECEDLKEPASLQGSENSWVIEKGVKLLIAEEEGQYLFTEKEKRT